MRTRTVDQLRKQYGRDVYLVVSGSKGDMCPDPSVSEAEAISRYEKAGGKAVCTIVCIPSETLGRICHRGWVAKGWKWDPDRPDSLSPVPCTRTAKPRGQACEMQVENADITITDPVYLLDDPGRDKLMSLLGDGRTRPQTMCIDGREMLFADTIYGDWMCELLGTANNRKMSFGKFTADAGMVCVATGDWESERLQRLPALCWTRIPNFTGTVRIRHWRNTCTVEGSGTSNGVQVEFASRQIG